MSEEQIDVEEVSSASEEQDHGENLLGSVEEETVVADDSQVPETVEESTSDGNDAAALRDELARQKERNDFLEKVAFNNQPQPQVPAEQAPEYDPEDLATNATVEEMVEKRVKAIEQKAAQDKVTSYESAARSTYTDYDDVAIKLTSELIRGNPAKGIPPNRGLADALVASVNRGENASELAYSFGKTHPEYSNNAVADGVKNLTSKIEKNLNTPQTLSNATRSQPEKIDENYWNNQSKADFEKERLKRLGLI